MPTMRGRNQVDAASGTIPSRPNTNPIRALVEASRRSIARVIVAPMPTAGPLIAAIAGFGSAWIARVTLPPVSRTPSSYGASAYRARNSFTLGRSDSSRPKTLPSAERSMLAQNARPAPVTTTARTSSFQASSRKTCSSSRAIVRSKALSWSGRSRVTVAMPSPSTSQPRVSKLIGRSSGDALRQARRGAEALRDVVGPVLLDVVEHLPGPVRVPVDREVRDRHDAAQVDVRHRRRPLGGRDRARTLAEGEEVGDRHVEVPVAERVDERPGRHHLVTDGGDDLALVLHTGDVAVPRVGVTGARVAERGGAVRLLAALLDVQ